MSADLHTRIEELEREVARLTEQNSESTRELDAFVYAVSHDLRAPLRSLSGFSQALFETDDALKQRHYLERIQQASRKLSELIEALLTLSRIARTEVHAHEVDFSQLCSDAAATIAAKYPNRTVQLGIAPNMRAFCDHRLLRVALEHLLDNAWKFSAGRNPATVDIGQRPSGEFYIADNGVGFDPAFAYKLFKPFQRLHGEAEFSGIGIGLAAVQRIIARHCGAISIVGRPGSGATAIFSLPASGNV